MTVLSYIIGIIVFLYSIFVLSRDDYLLIRKNVSQETMFSLSLFCILTSLFIARVVFALERHHVAYLNPLVFFALQYFPGLSLTGGMLGFLGGFFIFAKRQKLPFARIVDILSLAALYSFSSGLLVHFLGELIITHHPQWDILVKSIAMCGTWGLLLWFWNKKNLHAGSVGILAIATTSAIFAISAIVLMVLTHGKLSIDAMSLIVLFVISFVCFLLRKRLFFTHD